MEHGDKVANINADIMDLGEAINQQMNDISRMDRRAKEK